MANITLLSSEILLKIFTELDKTSQAGECRLVCKSWSSLAEMAMLNDVKLYQDEKMMKLFRILVRTPSKARFIKHIYFNFDKEMEPWHKEALRLAITPNLESMDGLIDSRKSSFFQELQDIVQKSAVKFDKMKRLAVCEEFEQYDFYGYAQLWPHFQDSLQDLEIVVDEFQDWVDEYSKLSQLKKLSTLSLETTDLEFYGEELEMFLNYLPHLRTLDIYTTGILHEQEDLEFQECESLTKRQDQLQVLKLRLHQCSANYIRYFVHKYTNLQEIQLEIQLQDGMHESAHSRLAMKDIKSVLAALKPVPKRKARIYFDLETCRHIGALDNLIVQGFIIEARQTEERSGSRYIRVDIKNL